MSTARRFTRLAAAAMFAVLGLAWGVWADAPVIRTANLPFGIAGEEYWAQFEADVYDITWSVVSGDLPPEFEFNENGYISGLPEQAGTYTFTVMAENGDGSDTKEFSVAFVTELPPLFENTRVPGVGRVGVNYREEIVNYTTEGEYEWSAAGLPEGLELTLYCVMCYEPSREVIITGTPTAAGTYAVTLTASNAGGSQSIAFDIKVELPPRPAVTQTFIPGGGIGGAYYNEKIARLKEDDNYGWNITNGSLPLGLEINVRNEWDNALQRPVNFVYVSGTPAEFGTYPVTLVMTNAGGVSDPITFTVTVAAQPKPVFTYINPAPKKGGQVGAYYYVYDDGGAVARLAEGNYTWDKTTGLPLGLEINSYNNSYSECEEKECVQYTYHDVRISGIPTLSGAYNVKLIATNAGGDSDPVTFTITIAPPPPPVIAGWDTSYGGTVDGELGVNYYATIGAGCQGQTPGLPPPPDCNIYIENWSIFGGSLPPGLELENGKSMMEKKSIMIIGTPTQTGAFTFTLKAENEAGFDTKQFTITIKALQKPVITTAEQPPSGEIGVAYWHSIRADGSKITSGSVTGLPQGLNYDWYDGSGSIDVNGYPAETGTFPITVTFTNGAGSDTKNFTIVITELQPPVITTASLPNFVINRWYQGGAYIEADGSNIEWDCSCDLLPPELNFSGYGNSAIIGFVNWSSPTQTGTYPITVTVTNAAGSDTKNFTIVVTTPPPAVITTTTLPDGSTGSEYEATIYATGDYIEWSVVGDLPPGLSSEYRYYGGGSHIDLDIKGTPTETGSYTFTVTAANYESSDSKSFTILIKPPTAILSTEKVITAVKPNEGATVIAPASSLTGEFTAGPNPVVKSAGRVNFFRQGRKIANSELRIYDAVGNVISKVKISDNKTLGSQARRIVGSWDLTDKNGRQVSEGTYLVRGVIKTSDGNSEKVSVILGVR